MSQRFDLITQQLLGKDLNDCSVEELQHLTEQYPYFAPTQFALLQKLKQVASPEYSTQVQKAILYYHNPFAFDHFMNRESYEVEFEPKEIEHPVLEEVQENKGTELAEAAQAKDAESTYQEKISKEEEPVLEISPNGMEPTIGLEETGDEQAESNNISETFTFTKTEAEEEHHNELQLPKLAIEEPKANEQALAFEPFHTVDYFASQGIKLSKEEATQDKFGKQLKSFTEWLKTMKKLPVAEQQNGAETSSEKKVESLAAHSVEKAEILTETMAEVWAKQGNKEKALEIYQQLSLLNPSKMAYFAAKIDSLK